VCYFFQKKKIVTNLTFRALTKNLSGFGVYEDRSAGCNTKQHKVIQYLQLLKLRTNEVGTSMACELWYWYCDAFALFRSSALLGVLLPRKESWEDHSGSCRRINANENVRNARSKKLLRKKCKQQKQEKEHWHQQLASNVKSVKKWAPRLCAKSAKQATARSAASRPTRI